MSGQANKQCPRCGSFFSCNATAVALCQCAGVAIETGQREYIKAHYDDCLCRACLLKLKNDLGSAK